MRRSMFCGAVLILGIAAFAVPPKDVLTIGARTDIIVDLEPARAYEVFTDLIIE